jgi:RNA ligase (TIGR02306 family)
MSDHSIPVIKISSVGQWPNSDNLNLIEIGGYKVASKKGNFKDGDLAVYVPPDFQVDCSQPEFDWLKVDGAGNPAPLKTHHRVTAKKLRGAYSEGILVAARPEWKLDQDVASILGITRYEPPTPRQSGGPNKYNAGREAFKGPALSIPKYDIEASKRYYPAFLKLVDTQDYVSCEKIHGANSRFVFHNGVMYCGSRTLWKPSPGEQPVRNWLRKWCNKIFRTRLQFYVIGKSWWHSALEDNPWIEPWCRAHPGLVLFGEVFGPQVQDLNYSIPQGKFGFRAFDVYNPEGGQYWSFKRLTQELASDQLVPTLAYNSVIMAEGISRIDNKTVREGLVYRGYSKDYYDDSLPHRGRLILKDISLDYLTR